MKRPDTILARTALVLVLAVLASLAVALFLFASQRHDALNALGGRNAAERVASMVSLTEDTPPEARRQILRSMDSPGFHAAWNTEPAADPDQSDPLTRVVAHHLAAHLDGRALIVASGHSPRTFAPGMGRMRHSPGPTLWISVQLRDGSWLNVAAAPPDPGAPLWRPNLVMPLLAALLAVILAALWAVHRATRPLTTLAAAAERLGVDVTAPPMAEDGPREVRLAARAFNVMQGRIRRFVEDRTGMLAAISHDLRTPITRMKLRAEFIEDDEERARMLADLDEMERMIASTLAFARDDAAREERRPVDVAALIQGLVEDLVATGAEACYAGPERLVAEARPMALKRALANLLDNAVKYGTRARASIEESGGDLTVIIEDDGPGIPKAEHERVFAPFVRLESSRNRETGGSGLGLAVARAAARAHGGDIHLENREGGGLIVRLILPRNC